MMILNLSLSLSSLKNRAKLLLSSLPVSPSRVLRAPGTSSYHLVPKHLRATWPRPEQSHLLPEACSPNGTDNRQQRGNARDKRSVPRPNPATFLRDFTLYMTSNDAILWKRCLNYITCLTLYCILLPIGNMWFQLKLKNNSCNRGLIFTDILFCV